MIAYGEEKEIDLKYNEMKELLGVEDLKVIRLYRRLNRNYCEFIVREALFGNDGEFLFRLNKLFNSSNLFEFIDSYKSKVSGF